VFDVSLEDMSEQPCPSLAGLCLAAVVFEVEVELIAGRRRERPSSVMNAEQTLEQSFLS
jgi:hypothetical protein